MKQRYIYIPLLAGGLTPIGAILVLELVAGHSRRAPILSDLLREEIIITALALVPFVALIGVMKMVSHRLSD